MIHGERSRPMLPRVAAYRLSAMPVDVLRVADRVAGNAIEGLTSAHHARRLGKLGHSAQRTPPDDGRLWAAWDPPPRAGNAIDVLIEGAAYFPLLEQAIRGGRSVLIAGWCITPGFALVRDEPPVLLRELLGKAAESVDVPCCCGQGLRSPCSRRAGPPCAKGAMSSCAGRASRPSWTRTSDRCIATTRKLVVIDDEVAFVGGIDVTDLGGDRFDTPEHPARGRMDWHDVASRLRGAGGRRRRPPPRSALASRHRRASRSAAGGRGERR
jgi:hypothetical protein